MLERVKTYVIGYRTDQLNEKRKRKMKILVLNTFTDETYREFYTEAAQKRMNAIGTVVQVDYDGTPSAKEHLLQEAENAEVIFTGWGVPDFDEAFYQNAQKLKIIAHTGGSVADLVSDSLKRRQILLLSGNRYYAESVAEATICYMLMGQRKLYKVLKQTEFEGWGPAQINAGLYGKTVGLLGFGMISKYVAKMLSVFNVHILVCSSHQIPQHELREYAITQASAEEMFSQSDIVSIHSAMTSKTYHSVNRELLSRMKENALLVNTARGAVVDEDVLAEFLIAGKIRAVLDVFTQEPLPMDSPLRGLDNALLVPHKGGPTADMMEVTTLGLIDDVEAFFCGKPGKMQNVISMDYAERMTSHRVVDEVKNA